MVSELHKRNDMRASRWRRCASWFAALVVVPVLLLVALEGMLRLADFGEDRCPFIRRVCDGRTYYVRNIGFFNQFFWGGFGAVSEAIDLFEVPRTKPPNTVRIFVLGGSAAQGWPGGEVSFPRVLDAMLESSYPDTNFEVFNGGYICVNSHIMRVVAKACARFEPDFFLVYMGNNEAYGPFGLITGAPNTTPAPSLFRIRAHLFLANFRVFQAMGRVTRTMSFAETDNDRRSIRPDDPRLTTVFAHFGRNLDAICSMGEKAGAEVLVGTVGVNLRDWMPRESVHLNAMSDDSTAQWNAAFTEGIEAQGRGEYAAALQAFERAATLDNTYAELAFRQGQCWLNLKEQARAENCFARALDLDGFQWVRAKTPINGVIRTLAERREGTSTHLVDCAGYLAKESPHGIPGFELFPDMCHPDFHGAYVLARAFYDALAPMLPEKMGVQAQPAPEPPPREECLRLLCLTADQRVETTRAFIGGERQFREELEAVADRFEATIRAETPNYSGDELFQAFQRSLALMAPDFPLGLEYVQRLRIEGRVEEALKEAERLVQQFPCRPLGRKVLADLLMGSGDMERAGDELRKLIALHPEDADGYARCARFENGVGRPEEALRLCRRARRHGADPFEILCIEARAHVSLGRIEEAVRMLGACIAERPEDETAYEILDAVLQDRATPAERADAWQDVARRAGVSARAWFRCGEALKACGEIDPAIEAFRKAAELRPGDSRMRLALADALMESSGRAEALAIYRQAEGADVRRGEGRILDVAEARASYLAALGNDIENEDLYMLLDGLYPKAEDRVVLWEEVTRKWPSAAKAHLHLGLALERSGDVEGALISYQQAADLTGADGEDTQSLAVKKQVARGESLEAEGKLGEALRWYRAARRIGAEAEAACGEARVLARQGDVAAARAAYLDALECDPACGPAYEGLDALYPGDAGVAERLMLWRDFAAQHPDVAQAQFRLGMALEDRGELGAAVAAYAQAHSLAPEDACIRERLAASLVIEGVYRSKQEQWDAGLARFEEAIELDPASVTAWCGVGAVQAHRGDLDAATRAYLKAIALDPDSVMPYHELDALYAAREDTAARVALWRGVVREHPQSALAHWQVGRALVAHTEPEEGLTHLRRACELAPDDAVLKAELGRTLFDLDRDEEAVEPLQAAAAMDESIVYVHPILVAALCATGAYEEAWAEAARCHALGLALPEGLVAKLERASGRTASLALRQSTYRDKPAAEAACGKAGVLARQGDTAAARTAYLDALEYDPGHGPAYEGLDALYPGDAGVAERLSLWRDIAALFPSIAQAQFRLGMALEDCGELGAAVAAYEQAHSLAPEDASIRERLTSLLIAEGVYQSNEARWDVGLARFEKALELDPASVTAWCGLGAVQAHRGDLDAATRAYLKAIALDPNFVMPYHELDALYESREHTAARVALWGKVVQDYPESPRAHWQVGQALVAHGEPDEGVVHLRRACELAPADAALKAELGRTLFDAGRTEDAVESLRAAAAMDESIAYVHPILVAALCATGAYEEAWTEVAKCRALGLGLPDGLIARLERESGRTAPTETKP